MQPYIRTPQMFEAAKSLFITTMDDMYAYRAKLDKKYGVTLVTHYTKAEQTKLDKLNNANYRAMNDYMSFLRGVDPTRQWGQVRFSELRATTWQDIAGDRMAVAR